MGDQPLPPKRQLTSKREVVKGIHYLTRPIHFKVGFNIGFGEDQTRLALSTDGELESYIESWVNTNISTIIEDYEEDYPIPGTDSHN